jgi:agmatine/peptidylarginine deiminase
VADQIELVILVETSRLEDQASARLETAGVPKDRIRFVHIATDSFWARDYGPLIVETAGGRGKLINTHYRGQRSLADAVPVAISKLLQNPIVHLPIDIEWGALLTNGAGLCLVSADVLRRNIENGFAEADVTNLLQQMTGAETVVYLQSLRGEPTGHLDVFATFVAPDRIVLGDFADRDPANDELLDKHAQRLTGLQTASGPLEVVRIPMPPRQGTREFTGSYTNVVFANGTLLVPTSPAAPPELQAEALRIYERLLPDWKVVGVDAQALWMANGGPHCATMNLLRLDASP